MKVCVGLNNTESQMKNLKDTTSFGARKRNSSYIQFMEVKESCSHGKHVTSQCQNDTETVEKASTSPLVKLMKSFTFYEWAATIIVIGWISIVLFA